MDAKKAAAVAESRKNKGNLANAVVVDGGHVSGGKSSEDSQVAQAGVEALIKEMTRITTANMREAIVGPALILLLAITLLFF